MSNVIKKDTKSIQNVLTRALEQCDLQVEVAHIKIKQQHFRAMSLLHASVHEFDVLNDMIDDWKNV